MAITNTFHPTTGFTSPIFPVYNDQTHLFTSTNSSKSGYNQHSDIYLNDSKVTTLVSYPFNSIIEVNPQLTKNYILHNFNYNLGGAIENPDSIKKVFMTGQESFNRIINYSSITNSSTFVQLDLTSSNNLTPNDRVYVVPNNTFINPQYKNYWNVLASTSNNITIDATYVNPSIIENGKVYEGVEMYDYQVFGSDFGFISTNPHNFNVGDTVQLVMDGYATAKLELTTGNTGSISAITINNIDIIGAPVPFNTTLSQTITDLVSTINSYSSNPEYTAYQFGSSTIAHIYSKRTDGLTANGLNVNVVYSGTLSGISSPSMFTDKRTDITGQGWNPQLSNIYTVKDIINANSFTINQQITGVLSNEPGSQRGSLINTSPYLFPVTATTTPYYVFNGANFYDYNNYGTEVNTRLALTTDSKFLTNGPKIRKFYSNLDLETLDIFSKPIGPYITDLNVVTYTSSTDSVGTSYLFDISSNLSGNTSDTYRKVSIGTGPWNINKISPNLINDNIQRYDVFIGNSATTLSETIVYKKACSKHTYHQIIFLNKWGAWDSFGLTASFQERFDITRTSFNKKRELVYSSIDYGADTSNRGKTNFDINSIKSIKLGTDWLSASEYQWLLEIMESPQVYLYIPELSNSSTIDLNVLFPINIVDSEVIKPNDRSTLRRLDINAEFSNKRINQSN